MRRPVYPAADSRVRTVLLAGLLASAALALMPGMAEGNEGVDVVLETAVGDITIRLYPDRAPASAKSFLELIDSGLFEDASFYRTVRPDNDRGTPVIEVIQGGLDSNYDSLVTVPHETTRESGLKHRDGTVSLARAEPGTASGAAFFICIGDQPALDFGGMRNPDGLGFAAFGQVIDGMDVVRAIHRQPAERATDEVYLQGQMLTEPVPILGMWRLSPSIPHQ